jgi:post-segregation antitoxin (ccd killing protein)
MEDTKKTSLIRNKKRKKRKALPITITVPEKLREEIRKYENLKISAICQKALQDAADEERAKNLDRNEVNSGVERLMKQMGERPKTLVSDYEDECYEEGKSWASSEASLKELIKAFEGEGDIFVVQEAYGNNVSVPSNIVDQDEHNELLFSFQDGAKNMWWEMRDKLEEKGYEF